MHGDERQAYGAYVTNDSDPEDQDGIADELAELKAEIMRLRAQVARLEEEKKAVLKTVAERDFERPPHYP